MRTGQRAYTVKVKEEEEKDTSVLLSHTIG
jgi:hypothetical protein